MHAPGSTTTISKQRANDAFTSIQTPHMITYKYYYKYLSSRAQKWPENSTPRTQIQLASQQKCPKESQLPMDIKENIMKTSIPPGNL